jgi:predicted PurR-regulated permease PerM
MTDARRHRESGRSEASDPPSPPVTTGYSSRTDLWRWSIRGAGLASGVLAVMAVAFVLQASLDVIVLVIISILLAAALDPLVDRLRVTLPLSRVQVIALVYVALVLLATGLAIFIVPTLVTQLSTVSERLPGLIADAKDWAGSIEPAVVGTTIIRLISTLQTTFIRGGVTGPDPNTVVEFGLTAADAALAVLTVVTLVFFWLISRETLQRFVLALLPKGDRRSVRSTWNQIEARLGQWFRGQLTVMITVGALTGTAYFLLGLESALLLGVFAGLAEIIPIVGPAIGAVPALLSAFVAGGPELVLLVAAVYVVIQVLEGHVLVPMVMRNAVGLPPIVVITSLLIGSAVAGLVGALLAVPVAAAIAVVLERAQARAEPVSLESRVTAPEQDEEPPDADEGSDGAVGGAGSVVTRPADAMGMAQHR